MTKKIELTNQMQFVIEEWEILDIRNWKKIILNTYEDREDGTFPSINDWIKFANKIDKENWLERYLKKYHKYYWISKIENTNEMNTFNITFEKPLEVCVSNVWERLIIEKIKKAKIQLSNECFWVKNWRQDKIANWINIFLNFKELLE